MEEIYHLPVLVFLICFGFAQGQNNITTGNPFEKFEYSEIKIATLSQGKYAEFHDKKHIAKIGSFLYDTRSKKITAILEVEEAKDSVNADKAEIISRFMSLDPLFREYAYNSPYAFSENRVIDAVELEGLEAQSYLATQLFGGVGQADISVAGDAGIVIAGLRIEGGVGVGYDSYNNFAVYYQRGGFADLFGVMDGPSYEGNPAETGEFAFGAGVGVEWEESYNWNLNSVLDLGGTVASFDVEVSAYKVFGVDVGVNMDSNENIVGINWGVVVGLGLPADIGISETRTTLLAFNIGDILSLASSKNRLLENLKNQGITEYEVSLKTTSGENGYTKLQWSANYNNLDGTQTISEDTGVSFRKIGEDIQATKRTIDSVEEEEN